jgi:CheY-like chemotaxis protein
MVNLPRHAPQTPLDTLRALLAEYSSEDPSFQGRLLHLLQAHRRQIFRELGSRLAQTTTPKGLRRAILALIPKFDWPEWTPHILQALQQEPDLGVFDEGCAALGVIATREACQALKQLQVLRNDPDRQVILTRELSLFQPQQAVGHYLSRLMEGQGNTKLALQGAKILSVCAGPEDLAALIEAHRSGDALTQRLALRIIASLPAPEATHYLLETLEQIRQEFIDLQQVMEIQRRTMNMGRGSAKPEFLRLVTEHFEARAPEAAECLDRANALEGAEAGPELEPLRTLAQGLFDRFLIESLTLLLEGKVARYSAYQSEISDAAEIRSPQLTGLCDQIAEILAYRVDLGLVTFQEVNPALLEAFRVRLGGDGFIQAFLNLLPAEETQVFDELLVDPDLTRRQRYLNALGSRENDALVPFFLKAMQDSIVDVGLLAIHHLGKLPSSFPALMSLFESRQPEQVRLAIRVFGENHTRLAAEPLVEFLQKDNRDDVLVEAVEALANIRYPAGAPVVLDMLHDGKPLNLQLALARALGQMETAQASLGLLQKSAALKQPQVLILALEGALKAFPAFDTPLPADQVPALMHLADRCFDEREGEGQRLRAMLALQDFYAFDKDAYEKLQDLFSDFLFNMRTKENWDRESNDKVSVVIKELARRSASLGLIAKKEAHVRAQLQALPPKGPRRAEALLALREALLDPELIIRPELAKELAEVVCQELLQKDAEWREVAHLCEIGGITHQTDLVEPIRAVFQRAKGVGLKSAARSALLSLGLSEADLNRRAPIQSILVIEPSAFFRKRLVSSLKATGLWTLAEAGNRKEAVTILESGSVDLVLTESHDAEGELGTWLEANWEQQRFRHALLSTANRDLGALTDVPWLLGALFKPYPTEQLLRALES